MSVSVQVVQVCELRTDHTPVARFDRASGDLFIYPAGPGLGPLIVMPYTEWHILRDKVEAAIRQVDPLAAYRACEGTGADD